MPDDKKNDIKYLVIGDCQCAQDAVGSNYDYCTSRAEVRSESNLII